MGDEDEVADLRVFANLEEKKMSKRNSLKVSDKGIIEITEPTVTQDVTFLRAKAFNSPLSPSKLKIIK